MDKISVDARSRNMANIRSKNTQPELILRNLLHKEGYRYRVHYPLKGKPDIVFPKRKFAIFVHGCFWHGHGCNVDHKPKSNSYFWKSKIDKNQKRDKKIVRTLLKEGWRVKTVWECDIRKKPHRPLQQIKQKLCKH